MTIPQASLQLIQNAPAAVGGLTSRAVGGRRSGRTNQPTSYGLTMWFKVVVDHSGGSARSLGLWSGCSGLGVNFNPEQLKAGGSYDGALWLPGEISYGHIVLERAMDPNGSEVLRSWLTEVATKWINADEAGAARRGGYVGTPLTIFLYSNLAADKEIAKWELKNAIPVAWSGPALSAKGSEVAIEKLTLAHGGFLTPSAPPAATARRRSAAAQPDQGKLKIQYNGETLAFQYNPVKVTLDKSVSVKRANVLATTVDQQVTDPGNLTIKLNDLRVEGATAVHAKIDKLFEWLAPLPPDPPTDTPPPAAGAGGTGGGKATTATKGDKGDKGDDDEGNSSRPKLLLLKMGAGTGPGRIERTVILKVIGVTYLRFSRTSVPTRASVTLTLEEAESPPAKQNPTSGGPPGRRVHTVTAGDNLQRIATATYGNPASWRRIAEANDIDDPLRVRNGRSLYLPGR